MRLIARRVMYHPRVGSTMDVAKQLADAGEAEGTIVIAEDQVAGRGRLSRSWVAPARSSLLMSLILRPAIAIPSIARVTMAISLAACDAIRTTTGLDTRIKWPNDILVNAKKCAGILAETGITGDQLEYVIIGIGLNVNFSARSIANIPREATTIADELGHGFPRAQIARALIEQIEHYYLRLRAGENLRGEWASRMATIGQRIRAHAADRIETGIAENVDDDGALIVRRDDGTHVRLLAGDVTLAEK